MTASRKRSSALFKIFRLITCSAATLPVAASALVEMIPPGSPEIDGATSVEMNEQDAPQRTAVTLANARRFDLVCDSHARVLEAPPPGEVLPQFWSDEPWDESAHYMVDLEAMQVCDISCTWQSPRPIASADADSIVFEDHPWFQWNVRRSDGRSFSRLGQLGGDPEGVIETSGYCRTEPFSGFPAIEHWPRSERP